MLSLLEHHASRNLKWTPDEIVSIRPYSGIAGALAYNHASREALINTVSQGRADMAEAMAAGVKAAAAVIRGGETTH